MTACALHAAAGLAAAAPAVRAVGLGKVIDDRTILFDVGFEIPPGGLVALLGANGAGKSTLLRILATLLAPSAGEVSLFGRPLRPRAPELRSRIGLIGHGAMLYRDLTVRENLVFFGRLHGVADAWKRAGAMLELTGLTARADDPVRTLSRGLVQRASIARALVHDPELLLADEPFAGLDAPSQRSLADLLASLRAKGRTIVLASHDLARSLALAERVLVLRGGRLVMDARSGGLRSEDVLAEVCGP